ncbi:MAG: hypothetical protein WCC29_17350 [Pseudomonas farsensis]|uniref:hypothetical protein n=1 Tax=Pseudomonas farsensis TaxID=2745492 RepID=UPI003C7D6B6A
MVDGEEVAAGFCCGWVGGLIGNGASPVTSVGERATLALMAEHNNAEAAVTGVGKFLGPGFLKYLVSVVSIAHSPAGLGGFHDFV